MEVKQKDGPYQEKRSLEVRKNDALELIDGNYDVLLKYKGEFAKQCYSMLKEGNYKPKTVVEYQRLAYIAKENSIRITFDSNVRATESNFNPRSTVILEVKFNGFLLEYIKNFIDNIEKSELSVSKYCLARQVSLGFVY